MGKMCSICAGSVCAGTGGCDVLVRHVPKLVKISYNSSQNYINSIQSYIATIIISLKDSFRIKLK